MSSSANSVIRASIFSALIEVVDGYRSRANGVMNVFARDLGTLHPNTAFDDLPDDIQKIIIESTDEAFRRLLKDGYVITPRVTQNTRKR